jgi:hypothetical protein
VFVVVDDQARQRGGQADRDDVEAEFDDREALPDLDDDERDDADRHDVQGRQIEQGQHEWDLGQVDRERVPPDFKVERRRLGEDEQREVERGQRDPTDRRVRVHRQRNEQRDGQYRHRDRDEPGEMLRPASRGADSGHRYLTLSAAVRGS